MPQLIELTAPPSTFGFYWRALTAKKSWKPAATESVLAVATLNGVRTNAPALKRYRTVCGFADSTHLPVTYPFVLSVPLHMELLVSAAFPFPVMGLVHVRNDITQHRRIGVEEQLDFTCTLIGPRAANKGLEFDFITKVSSQGQVVWSCVSTMLRRGKDSKNEPRESKPVATARPQGQTVVGLTVPEDIGRRYAAASGDVNPIHLHTLTAKALGFPRAIAHGMWTKARCLALLESQLPTGAFTANVSFKLPIFLPAEVEVHSTTSAGLIDFLVQDRKGKPHLAGLIQSIKEIKPLIG